MKPWLATLAGGAIMTSEIVGIEPSLAKDNRWRIEATLRSGVKFVLAPEYLSVDQAVDFSLELLAQVHRTNLYD